MLISKNNIQPIMLIVAGLTVGLTGFGAHRLLSPSAVAGSPDDQKAHGKANDPLDGNRRPGSKTKQALSEYVIEPGDSVEIDVLKTLPNHPIHGGRYVREDGMITLQYYGEIVVAGLSCIEVKEKLIKHLRQFLSDEDLGLKKEQQGRIIEVAPRDSERIAVAVTSSERRSYRVGGDAISSEGYFPATDDVTVLNAIALAGGLLTEAKDINIQVLRPKPEGEEKFTVDLMAINKGDLSTDYKLLAGDLLSIGRKVPERLAAGRNSKGLGPRAGRTRREMEAQIDIIIRQLNELKYELAEGEPRP